MTQHPWRSLLLNQHTSKTLIKENEMQSFFFLEASQCPPGITEQLKSAKFHETEYQHDMEVKKGMLFQVTRLVSAKLILSQLIVLFLFCDIRCPFLLGFSALTRL